jgi:hypothetical protein
MRFDSSIDLKTHEKPKCVMWQVCHDEDNGCMFLHTVSPECKFNTNCSNKFCQFGHSFKEKLDAGDDQTGMWDHMDAGGAWRNLCILKTLGVTKVWRLWVNRKRCHKCHNVASSVALCVALLNRGRGLFVWPLLTLLTFTSQNDLWWPLITSDNIWQPLTPKLKINPL